MGRLNKRWTTVVGLALVGAAGLVPAGRQALMSLGPGEAVGAAASSDDSF